MRQRLEELATLRALRRTFEAQRRSGASHSQHEAPEPVRAAGSLQHRRFDGQSRPSRGGHASEAQSGTEVAEQEANTGRLVGQPALPMRHVGDSDSRGEGSNVLDDGTSHETTLGQAHDTVARGGEAPDIEGWGETDH